MSEYVNLEKKGLKSGFNWKVFTNKREWEEAWNVRDQMENTLEGKKGIGQSE